ncbi:hypothetical protein [Xanthomarina gelatinilytica]|uniref:hypothetical protein n=1 Tax=Xanthomarina gelatinilytica TaxID=1137281 RepID=UPI003AA98090
MASKCTKAEKEKRVLQVQGWIIDGAQDDFILRQIKSTWSLTLRQAQKYLKEAYSNWLPDQKINIENRRAAKIAELKQMKRGLKPEYKGTPAGINALTRVEKLIIKLEDIDPPKRHEVKGDFTHKILPTKFIDATSSRNTSSKTSD